MDLYQVCSNIAPGAKNCPTPLGSHGLHILGIGKNMEKSSCLKPLGVTIAAKMTIAIVLTLQEVPLRYYYYLDYHCNTIVILLSETFMLV